MVELVPAVCPKCGANLQLPENLDKAHCIYCGTEIIIERKQPEIHYHGVGSLDNYLKLGNRELSTVIQMERAGIEGEVRISKQVFILLTVLMLLIIFPVIGYFIHPIVGVLFFIVIVVLIIFNYSKLQEKFNPQELNINYEMTKWNGATQVFWEHIEEAVKYYNKAIEINPENEKANQGYNESSQLRKKYYHSLDPQQQMISRLEAIKRQQAQPRAKSGCFIATAAYGTPMAEEINLLRQWRDETLMSTTSGRVLVKIYYIISPPIADFISTSEILRTITRLCINPFVHFAGVST